MKKNYIILISLIGLLMAAGIVILYVQKSAAVAKECGNVAPKEKDDCYARIAAGKNDASLCEKIQTSADLQSNCYTNIAVQLNDSSTCDKIQNSNPNVKELCYSSVASAKHNPSACERIQNSDLRNQCLATAKNDASFCANIKDSGVKVYPCSS